MITFNQITTKHIQLQFDCQIQPLSICAVRLLAAYHSGKKLVLMLQNYGWLSPYNTCPDSLLLLRHLTSINHTASAIHPQLPGYVTSYLAVLGMNMLL